MTSYEEIKQEMFGHENPETIVDAEAVDVRSAEHQLPQTSRPRNGLAIQIFLAGLMAVVVCGGALWYLNGSDSGSKKSSARRKTKESRTLVEWVLGRDLPRRTGRRRYGPFDYSMRDQQISVIRQHDPTYGFSETN